MGSLSDQVAVACGILCDNYSAVSLILNVKMGLMCVFVSVDLL